MILVWNIFEIGSKEATLHGVMLRGRIRKFAIENNISCLVENASDKENIVRFAVLTDTDPYQIIDFVKTTLPDANIIKILELVQNPVLSKLKVNDISRYNLK